MMQTEKEIRENLIDAGCSNSETDAILGCILQGKTKEADRLIGESRKKQLKLIHESQQCIDRLDYLSWQMKKGN
jgi:hypothetical protein